MVFHIYPKRILCGLTYEYEGTGDIDSNEEFRPLLVRPELLKALGD